MHTCTFVSTPNQYLFKCYVIFLTPSNTCCRMRLAASPESILSIVLTLNLRSFVFTWTLCKPHPVSLLCPNYSCHNSQSLGPKLVFLLALLQDVYVGAAASTGKRALGRCQKVSWNPPGLCGDCSGEGSSVHLEGPCQHKDPAALQTSTEKEHVRIITFTFPSFRPLA